VTCAESGTNPTNVRWCIQTACECRSGNSAKEQVETFGEIEATRLKNCGMVN